MKNNVSISFKIKSLFSQGFFYGITSSLHGLLSFLLLPLLTAYYTTEEFGIYSIIILTSSILGTIFYFGASSALGRFYFDKKSLDHVNAVISATLFIISIGAFIYILIATIFGNYISILLFDTDLYGFAVTLGFSGSAFGFLQHLMTLILRYEKKLKFFMIVMIGTLLINLITTYFLLINDYGVLSPLFGIVVSMSLGFSLICVYRFKSLIFILKKDYVLKILHFGVQISITSLLFYVLDFSDRFIMNELLTLSDVGIYSLGYKIGSLINIILILPFSYVWAPLRMEYVNNSNNKEFTSKVFSYFSLIGFILILFVVLFGKEIISFFITNGEYDNAIIIIPIIMLSILIYGFQNILDLGIYLEKKIYYYMLISISVIIINVVLNYIFLPKYGYIAAAYTTLVSYLISSLLIFLISIRFYKIELEWKRVLVPLFLLCIIYYAFNYIFIKTLLIGIVSFLLSIFLLAIYWLNKNEKVIIINFFKQLIKVNR